MWSIGIIGHKIENNNGYYVRDLKIKNQQAWKYLKERGNSKKWYNKYEQRTK